MFNLKRNQIIITVLVFMIAVAAYLNTQQPAENLTTTNVAVDDKNAEPEEVDFFEGYDEQVASNTQSPQPSQAAITDESAVDEQTSEAANAEQAVAEGQEEDLTVATNAASTNEISATITKKSEELLDNSGVAVSKNLDVDYFSEEKLLREQSRAQQIDQLTEYVSNENLDQEAKADAAANLIEIQERIEKESSAEALLKAKGFEEVYVRIDDDTVDVVVSKSELTDTEIAQIEEIVNRKTGYSVSKINITPLNGVAKK